MEPEMQCPNCQKKNWLPLDKISLIQSMKYNQQENKATAKKLIAQPIVCQECNYILLFYVAEQETSA